MSAPTDQTAIMQNTVIQGDCTAILKTLPAASVEFVLTDPPVFRAVQGPLRSHHPQRPLSRPCPRRVQGRLPRAEARRALRLVLWLEPRGLVLCCLEGRRLHARGPYRLQ